MNFDIKMFIRRTNYLKIPKLPKKSIKCNVPNIIKLQKKIVFSCKFYFYFIYLKPIKRIGIIFMKSSIKYFICPRAKI